MMRLSLLAMQHISRAVIR